MAHHPAVGVFAARSSYDATAVRVALGIMLSTAALAACGAQTGGGGERTDRAQRASADRVQKCVDRLVSRSTATEESLQAVRRYVERAYCTRFARNGWVYDDGALSIAAQTWLSDGAMCTTAKPGEPPRSVQCVSLTDAGPKIIDCALLHHVRQSEVRQYIANLRQDDAVECDDGTPVDDLGVPLGA
jgi:hypothetical protein